MKKYPRPWHVLQTMSIALADEIALIDGKPSAAPSAAGIARFVAKPVRRTSDAGVGEHELEWTSFRLATVAA
jgi:hypothetical protein